MWISHRVLLKPRLLSGRDGDQTPTWYSSQTKTRPRVSRFWRKFKQTGVGASLTVSGMQSKKVGTVIKHCESPFLSLRKRSSHISICSCWLWTASRKSEYFPVVFTSWMLKYCTRSRMLRMFESTYVESVLLSNAFPNWSFLLIFRTKLCTRCICVSLNMMSKRICNLREPLTGPFAECIEMKATSVMSGMLTVLLNNRKNFHWLAVKTAYSAVSGFWYAPQCVLLNPAPPLP